MATEMEFGLLGAIIVRGNGVVPTVPRGSPRRRTTRPRCIPLVLDCSAGAAVMTAALTAVPQLLTLRTGQGGRGIGAQVARDLGINEGTLGELGERG
jgi:hypothetical protein